MRAEFILFRDLPERIQRDMALERRGVQENQLMFKDHLFQAQESSIPMSRK